jgi:hypothetical protein
MMAALAPTPHPAATNTSVIGRAADMEVDETAWILPFIFQWVLLFAPAVVLRKYRCRPMSKGNAIGASAGISIFWVILAVLLADYLGIESGYPGGVNTGPIAIGALFSFWILRKESVFGDSASLKMRDRVFKKFFPETNTSCPAQTERGQHPQAAESRHAAVAARLKHRVSRKINKTTTSNWADVFAEARSQKEVETRTAVASQKKAEEKFEANKINDLTYYEKAFYELEDEDSRVIGVWAKAFAETDGDDQKAKAKYIKLRVESLISEEHKKLEIEQEHRKKESQIWKIEKEKRLLRQEEEKNSRERMHDPRPVNFKHKVTYKDHPIFTDGKDYLVPSLEKEDSEQVYASLEVAKIVIDREINS